MWICGFSCSLESVSGDMKLRKQTVLSWEERNFKSFPHTVCSTIFSDNIFSFETSFLQNKSLHTRIYKGEWLFIFIKYIVTEEFRLVFLEVKCTWTSPKSSPSGGRLWSRINAKRPCGSKLEPCWAMHEISEQAIISYLWRFRLVDAVEINPANFGKQWVLGFGLGSRCSDGNGPEDLRS